MLIKRKEDLPILIVEDSDEDFVTLERVLRKSGITNPLVRCETGDDAIRHLSDPDAPRPGLIFLDLNLPGTDGRAVLARVKSDEELRAIPVLVLTSSQSPRDIHGSYRGGANTYILKPEDPKSFRNVVDAVRDYWLGAEGAVLGSTYSQS